MLRVVPGSIPGETLLLLVQEVFFNVLSKREEFGSGFRNFGGGLEIFDGCGA
jgi:hypothetical protein